MGVVTAVRYARGEGVRLISVKGNHEAAALLKIFTRRVFSLPYVITLTKRTTEARELQLTALTCLQKTFSLTSFAIINKPVF